MSAPASALVEHGVDILGTIVDKATNRVLAFLGDVKAKLADSDRAKWVQHVGWVSLPGLPVAGKSAAQAVVIRRSDGDVVVGSCDARTLEMYGAIGPGECAMFSGGPDGSAQGRILIKKDGSINLYTRKGNTSGGAGMTISVNAESDQISIVNGNGIGLIISDTGIQLTTGGSGAGLSLGADGSVKLIGTAKVQIDGAGIVLGSIAVPVANAAIHGPAGMAGIASLKTLIE
jgi:hypothetical protein